MVFRASCLAVSCRGGEFALRSVCMAATLRRSVVWRPVCGGQLSCTENNDLEVAAERCLFILITFIKFIEILEITLTWRSFAIN